MLTAKDIKIVQEPWVGFYAVDEDEPCITVKLKDYNAPDTAEAIGIRPTHFFDAISAHAEYNVPDGSVKIHIDVAWRDGEKFDGQNYVYTPTDGENAMLVGKIERYVKKHSDGRSCAEVLAHRRQPADPAEEESSVCGVDFSASCPWRAPGMSVDDFI